MTTTMTMTTTPPASVPTEAAREARLGRYREMVRPALLAAVAGREPARYLYGLVAEHLGRAGKGLRPALCLATAEAFGADPRRAVPSAAALEMLHNAFLVHDDIEDGSESRRNRPTLYMEHGVPLAINVGDAMQALSLGMLKDNLGVLGPALTWRVVAEFEHMLLESLEGQALELGWIRDNNCDVTEDDYLTLVLKKTCWYSFIHPCRIGALIAGDRGAVAGSPESAFDRFGYLLGAAFQIQDDVLNLVGDRDRYGKEIGGDLWEGKRTLILAHVFGRGSEPDRARLRQILGKPRGARLPEDVAWIYELLGRHGSIDYARAAARTLGEAAAQELERAFANAPESEAKDFLRWVVRHAVARDL